MNYRIYWQQPRRTGRALRSSVDVEANSVVEAISQFERDWSLGGSREIVQVWRQVANLKPQLIITEDDI